MKAAYLGAAVELKLSAHLPDWQNGQTAFSKSTIPLFLYPY